MVHHLAEEKRRRQRRDEGGPRRKVEPAPARAEEIKEAAKGAGGRAMFTTQAELDLYDYCVAVRGRDERTLAHRPGEGRLGRSVQLKSNFAEVRVSATAHVHQYELHFTDDMGERIDDDKVPPPERRVEMLTRTSDGAGTIVEAKLPPGQKAWAYDGNKIIYTTARLIGVTDASKTIDLQAGRGTRIVLTETRQGSLGLNGPTIASNFAEHRWQMQVIDVAMRHDKSLVQKRIGVAFFDPEQRGTRVGSKELWLGMKQTVQLTGGSGKAALLVDLGIALVKRQADVIEFLCEELKCRGTPRRSRRS